VETKATSPSLFKVVYVILVLNVFIDLLEYLNSESFTSFLESAPYVKSLNPLRNQIDDSLLPLLHKVLSEDDLK